jgi:hypothetical protein
MDVSEFLTLLVIIADGRVDEVKATSDAIVEASKYPL